jgi:hypothetical protein
MSESGPIGNGLNVGTPELTSFKRGGCSRAPRLLEGENLMHLSQVSRSQFGVIHPSGNLLFEFIETAA